MGVLVTDARSSVTLPTFVQGLRDLGYVDGKKINVDIQSADGKPDAFPGLAAELIRRKVDVIYATGPAAIEAARGRPSVIPIVALDPVRAGWIKSLARPGGKACFSIFPAWPESGWSCSKRRRREFDALACCGIRPRALRN